MLSVTYFTIFEKGFSKPGIYEEIIFIVLLYAVILAKKWGSKKKLLDR